MTTASLGMTTASLGMTCSASPLPWSSSEQSTERALLLLAMRGLVQGIREFRCRGIAIVRASLHALQQHLLHRFRQVEIGACLPNGNGLVAETRNHHLL